MRKNTDALAREAEKAGRGDAKTGRIFVAFHLDKADWDAIRAGALPRGYTVTAYLKAFVLANRDRLAIPPEP